ncbi:class I SAM-dependent methyltransferase [Streptomyces adelaidensis]|uniref:class I SAM-dependent methyltransferase n=1 Tax=Streptomyces adelaidensis TaxID=2796465 RepID=UPI0019036EF0|nr:class I SAM-dependent methyltransferase [Streptomyces adelaidensis]
MSRYLFDNADDQTRERFSVLESRYDPWSRKALENTGVGPGWRCLEVGGGGGSLGDWLGERVGPDGEVLVTDLDPRWAVQRQLPANVRLLTHDITRDPMPGDGDFDLVHARLVLLHLPERTRVLERLTGALRPGGWLVLEEFDCGWTPVLATPDGEAGALFERVHGALLEALGQAGAEPLWGRQVVGEMMRAGLEGVTATTYAETWAGGGQGIKLHRANIEQAARRAGEAEIRIGAMRIGDTWLGDGELRRFLELLDDPGFVVNSYPMVSARGRRVAGAGVGA